ncbi:hypothetical protein ACFY0F_02725 [Streptomyces sp. NPDC001544]|uniref:hypothetical protein n=1 Tax=Streptomyces sp. NPDC001544 TaxID=3364584 RepID=UPI0036B87873
MPGALSRKPVPVASAVRAARGGLVPLTAALSARGASAGDGSPHVVSATTADGRITVRTAN